MSTNYKNIKKLGLGIICFEGTEHLANIISELRDSVDYVTIGLLRLSYHGDPIPEIDLREIFRLRDEDHLVDNIVEIKLDTNKAPREQETDKRNIIIQNAEDHGCSHVIVIDSDEYYTKKSFESACQKIDDNDYEMTYCQYVNYYHDYTHFLVYPFKQGMYVPFVSKVKYRHSFECTDFPLPSDPTRRYVRPFDGYNQVKGSDGKYHKVKNFTVGYHVFEWKEVKMHHLSWLRADIRKKLNMWSSKKCFENYNDLIDKAVNSFKNFNPNSTQAKALMLFNTPGNSVDVKAFPKQYIHPKFDFNTRLRPCKEKKRLLVLSMSATGFGGIYDKLEDTSNITWRNIDKEKYPNIDVQFWTYTDTEEEKIHIDIKKHIIYIPDNKEFPDKKIYHTYSKTIKALKVIEKLNIQYDYLIRTNNSTWLNIPLINEFLSRQTDDSLMFTGRIYAGFWSAFNIYGSGELLIFSKRGIDILKDCAGEKFEEYEHTISGCDDNLIGGVLNRRLIENNLRQSDYLHSIDDGQFIDKTIPDDLDFSLPGMQIKTYGVEVEDRVNYDLDKMKEIDKRWKEQTVDISELCDKLIENHYDKDIHILTYNKKEYFELSDEEKTYAKFKLSKPRKDALEYLTVRQKECGYHPALI